MAEPGVMRRRAADASRSSDRHRSAAAGRRSTLIGAASADDRPLDVRLDQYYTRPDVARRLYEVLLRYIDPAGCLIIEPSAGTGAFFRLLPEGSLAYDVDPKFPGIEKRDFLKVKIKAGNRKIIVVGNPPFGTQARTALRFVNYAAEQRADVVAFILPRTFRKMRMQNEVDPFLHLIHEEIVPAKAFLFRGKPYNVPAVFQIWERREVRREKWLPRFEHADFEFAEPDPDTFGLQRVGARAGMVHDDLTMSIESHYFIRAHHPRTRRIMEELRTEFASVASNVAGPPSLAKSELVALYEERLRRDRHR